MFAKKFNNAFTGVVLFTLCLIAVICCKPRNKDISHVWEVQTPAQSINTETCFLESTCQTARENTASSNDCPRVKKCYDLFNFTASEKDLASYRKEVGEDTTYRYWTDVVRERLTLLKERNPSAYQIFSSLLEEELNAIIYYVDAYYVNKALRGTIEDRISAEFYIKVLSSALNKLPKFTGTVVRGEKDIRQEQRDWKAGDITVQRGFLSTSALPEPEPAFRGQVTLKIDVNSCPSIADFSDCENEKEVLCPPGAKFEIISSEISSAEGKESLTSRMKQL